MRNIALDFFLRIVFATVFGVRKHKYAQHRNDLNQVIWNRILLYCSKKEKAHIRIDRVEILVPLPFISKEFTSLYKYVVA